MEQRNEFEYAEQPETKKDTCTLILFSVVGLVITVGSFILYHICPNPIVTVLICLADLVYAYFNARIFFKSKDWNGTRQIFIPLMMIFYWVIVFGILCIGNALLLKGEFFTQLLLYPIFLMPSFVLEILLVGLIGYGI